MRGKFLPNWYGNWQVDGVRKWVTLNPWEGVAPKKGEEKGDAAFEHSRNMAEMMLAGIMGGEDEAFAEIRQKVSRQLERFRGNAAGIGKLIGLLAGLTTKLARELEGGGGVAVAGMIAEGENQAPPGTLPGLDFSGNG